MQRKSGWCPSEASFSGIHADGSAGLVALKSQAGPDRHPLLVTDIVCLPRTLAARAVLPGRKTNLASAQKFAKSSSRS